VLKLAKVQDAKLRDKNVLMRVDYNVPIKEGVQPLGDFRLADVDVVKAAANFDAMFDLIERVGLP
jgi:3-phosphoglycerate kinase